MAQKSSVVMWHSNQIQWKSRYGLLTSRLSLEEWPIRIAASGKVMICHSSHSNRSPGIIAHDSHWNCRNSQSERLTLTMSLYRLFIGLLKSCVWPKSHHSM